MRRWKLWSGCSALDKRSGMAVRSQVRTVPPKPFIPPWWIKLEPGLSGMVIIFGAIDGAIGTALVGGVMGTAIGSMARVIQLVALLFSVILLATAQFGYGGWGGGFGMGSVVGAIDGAMIGAVDGAMIGSMFGKK
ncbi:hypothetical protein RB195_014722 [Necator americanus]|uniref:Uncharacterized protein n=1 Tax=Necator americanus TaxID=51031 RepID=A0ABR1E1H4_NECAM